jgi:exopolysaccharide biosynthesis polyprenyl glycosylphosphotransferase
MTIQNFDIRETKRAQQKGTQNMARSRSADGLLRFTPFLKGSDALTKKIGRARFPSYQTALLAHDCIAVMVAFGFSIWISGLSPFLFADSIQSVTLFILALLVIAFFPTYNLYSYHFIFSSKNHLVNLIKSFCWGLLNLGIIVFLYTYPYLLEGRYVIPLLFLAAIGILLLSRFFWDHILYLLKSLGMSFLAIGIIGLITPEEKPIIVEQWTAILIGFAMAVGIILVSRSLLVHVVFNDWMRRHFRRQVAIVGSDQEAQRITNHIIEKNAPFWVTGFVGAEEVSTLETPVSKGRLGELKELPLIVRRQNIDEIIITDENIDKRILISLLDYCTSEGLTVWFSPKLMPIIDLKLHIDVFCGLQMIRLCSQKNSYIFNKIKHGFDALIVLPVFLLLLPLFVMIGIAIKLTSHGPVFFRAKAVGRNGKPFCMYKFRSMQIDTGNEVHKEYVTKLINGKITHNSGNGGVFKITDDQRITSIGKFLRKLSLDELPQLINVLKGEMSLVGPRPCLPYEYEAYKDWHKKRLSIRPGITGVWQVTGRSAVSFEDMVLLDLYYIYNRNILMDMNILYETIFAVLEKRGAY